MNLPEQDERQHKRDAAMPSAHLRLASRADLPAIRQVELAAAARFDAADMPVHRREETLDGEAAEIAIGDNHLWVAEQGERGVVAFLAARAVDGYLHILEMSTLPAVGRAGIGRALIETAIDAARLCGFAGVTLTTFSHVPWNGPWYERIGFRCLGAGELPAHVCAELAADIEAGLLHRVGMIRPA